MGRQSGFRALRKQLRITTQEILPSVLNTEILVDAGKKCADLTNSRMDDVAKQAASDLKKIDEQTQVNRSFIKRELESKISNELYNINCSMVAFMEVLADKVALTGIEFGDLAKAVEEKKVIVMDRMQREAREAQMKADQEAKLEAERDAEVKRNTAASTVKVENEPTTASSDVT